MTTWHIVTSEYPPDVGGVSDYTRQIAEALVRDGDEVHVWCPPSRQSREASRVHVHSEAGRFRWFDLRRLGDCLDAYSSPRRLLVQWVPHGFGYRSMNLWFCLWLARRAARGDRIELMVHEPFIELKRRPLRHVAVALVHRVMTIVLMGSVRRVWVSIPAWEPLLRPYAFGRTVRIDWLPVPACVTALRDAEGLARETHVSGAQPLIGHFGSYGREVSTLLMNALPAMMDSSAHPSLLLIGARSQAFRDTLIAQHPAWSTRVHATGYVASVDLTRYLEVCDLFLQPYPDGITSRRTSVMACLAMGRPIVSTTGHLTEPLWETSGAVKLAPVSEPQGLVSAALQLMAEPDERKRLGRAGLRLYRDRFTLAGVTATLRAASSEAM
jgi:glycosyltransferase involved in cell wall biosynthesis